MAAMRFRPEWRDNKRDQNRFNLCSERVQIKVILFRPLTFE